MNFAGLAVLIGVIFGLFITAAMYMAIHTDGKLMGKYDEKQILARAKDPYGVEVRAATDSLGGFSFGGHRKKKKGFKNL